MPTAYSPAGGSVMPSSWHLARRNASGMLHQDARAVAAVLLAAARAAVVHVLQHLQRIGDDRVRRLALHVADEPDAAGVVFKARIVQSLLPG